MEQNMDHVASTAMTVIAHWVHDTQQNVQPETACSNKNSKKSQQPSPVNCL